MSPLRLVAQVPHNAKPTGAAFSEDGRLLATCDSAGECIVWDAATGMEVRRFATPRGATDVAISGDRVALVDGRAVSVWSVTTRDLLFERDMLASRVAIRPDGELLTATNNVLNRWEGPVALEVGVIPGNHTQAFGPTGMSRSGSKVVFVGIFGDVIVMADDGSTVFALTGRERVTSAAVGERFLVVANTAERCERWDLTTGERTHELLANATRVGPLSPDERVVYLSASGGVVEWDTGRGTSVVLPGSEGADMVASSDDAVAWVATGSGSLLRGGRSLPLGASYVSATCAALVSDQGDLLYSRPVGGLLWDEQARELRRAWGPSRPWKPVAWTPGAGSLVVCDWTEANPRLVTRAGDPAPSPEAWSGARVEATTGSAILLRPSRGIVSELGDSFTGWCVDRAGHPVVGGNATRVSTSEPAISLDGRSIAQLGVGASSVSVSGPEGAFVFEAPLGWAATATAFDHEGCVLVGLTGRDHRLVRLSGDGGERDVLPLPHQATWIRSLDPKHIAVLSAVGELTLLRDGADVLTVRGVAGSRGSVAILACGRLVTLGADGVLRIWDVATRTLVGLLGVTSGGWAVLDSDGRFEASDADVDPPFHGVPDDALTPLHADGMVRDRFTPGLLGKLLRGERLPPPPAVGLGDLRCPNVTVEASANGGVADVRVTVQPQEGSPPAEVCLLRNARLIRTRAIGPAAPGAPVTVTFPAVRLGSGEQSIAAFAYRRDGIKSRTGRTTVGGTRTTPTHRMLAIGVSDYVDPALRLRYAAADARAMGGLGPGDAVTLVDRAATRDGIRGALTSLASRSGPDDLVVISLAGHGTVGGGGDGFRFLAADATPSDGVVTASDLASWLVPLDADIVLIVDACTSGAAIDATELRPAITGSLSHVVWSKRMRLLAACGPADLAIEHAAVGHGLLTWALVEEGIRQHRADLGGDGLSVGEWLRWGRARVPALARELLDGRLRAPSSTRDLRRRAATLQTPVLHDCASADRPLLLSSS